MASKKYEVVAITGKYTDKDGQEKARFANIGVVLQTDKGFRLKLESVPIGWDGWARLKEPQPREQSQPKPAPQRPAGGHGFEDMPDDTPF